MQDYRHNPEDSPLAWCPHQQRLVKVTLDLKVMKTVFYVHPTGIYPYANMKAIGTRAVS